jgi:hypothetical protein
MKHSPKNLKLRLIKEEQKIKKRLLNETTAATSAFYSHTPANRGRGRFPHRFPPSGLSGPSGPSRGLSHSGRGYSPSGRGFSPSGRGFIPNSGRGISPFRRGSSLPDSRRSFHSTPRYSAAELAHVKQHTRCIECGDYGHWRQECPHLLPHNSEPISTTRVHLAEASRSSFSSDSSITSEVSPLPVEPLLFHDDLYHDTVEQLQLEESYSEDYSEASDPQSTHPLSRVYMAVSPSVSSTLLLDAWIADSGACRNPR